MTRASESDGGSERPARLSLRLLGGFELAELASGRKLVLPAKRDRVALAFLALSPNGRASRRKLATLLWGEAGDATALDNLRVCIWSLRKLLGDAEHRIIASEGEDVVLDQATFDIDVLSMRRFAARSVGAELAAAAQLYSGEFLDGLGIESEDFESWRREEATRCRDLAVDVLNRLMTQLSEAGETDRAIEAGTRILRLEPMHEAAMRRLMRLYGGSGRRGMAVELYRTFAEALHRELNAQPEAETRAVLAEVSRGGEERTQAPPTADSRAPFLPASRARPSEESRELAPVTPQIASVDGAPSQTNTHKSSWIVAAGLAAAVIAIILLYRFAPTVDTISAQSQGGIETASALAPVNAISIAVMPFVNLSGDASQEFFSDGMTEEISGALAKIPDLRVVGRSSAFQFKGENKDLRAIGKALGATHLIEGSVRNAGAQVRIAVQLVQADNGLQVWSETYDRELTDVFAIQEAIAKAIAASFQKTLGLRPDEALIVSRLADPDIYEQYLRLRSNTFPVTLDAKEAFVARAPGFAPGWAMLTGAYRADAAVAQRRGDFKTAIFLTDKDETAARKAMQLDASYAGGYSELAGVQTRRGKWAESEDLYKHAIALDPNDATMLNIYSQTLTAVGRLREALGVRERMRALEPLAPNYNPITARILLANGRIDASIALLEPDLSTGAPRNVYLAEAYAIKGRFADAADTLLRITTEMDRRSVEDAARLLRSAPGKADQPVKLPTLVAELGFIYAHSGAPKRMFEFPEQSADEGNFSTMQAVWRPTTAPLRKTARFKALVRKAGLVDYWRARGWPDLCRPVGADDFVCD